MDSFHKLHIGTLLAGVREITQAEWEFDQFIQQFANHPVVEGEGVHGHGIIVQPPKEKDDNIADK